MPHKETKKRSKQEDVLEKVVDWFDQSWEYAQSNYHQKWEDAWLLYNNQRVDVAYEGVTNTFVPLTFSTIETMVAALAGGRPRFDFVPTKESQETNTKVLNSLIDNYWDSDGWTIKVMHWIRSMLVYGTGVLYVYWDIDRPRIINVPIRDFIVDPTATNPEDAHYMGRRYLTTKDTLKDFKVVDPEDGELKNRYKNINKIPDVGDEGQERETDKEMKDMWIGSTLGNDASNKQIEVIEIWTEDRVYSVANRSVVIEDEENPYKSQAQRRGRENPSGLLPFIPQRNYIDESLFYGKSEVDPIKQQQELLNDLTNQNNDAIVYALNPMYTLDPAYSDWIGEVENVPGAVYPFRPNALEPIKQPRIPTDAFNERMNIKDEIRETSSADEIIKGMTIAGGDRTATEISAQLDQAGQRFMLKISQIEEDGFPRLAKILLDMIQLFVETEQAVRVVGSDGIRWEQYDPEQFEGEFEVKVQLESTVTSNKTEESQQAQNMYAMFFDNPHVNQQELSKMMLQKAFDLDDDEVQKLTSPAQPDGAPAEQGQQPVEQQPTQSAGVPLDQQLFGQAPQSTSQIGQLTGIF